MFRKGLNQVRCSVSEISLASQWTYLDVLVQFYLTALPHLLKTVPWFSFWELTIASSTFVHVVQMKFTQADPFRTTHSVDHSESFRVGHVTQLSWIRTSEKSVSELYLTVRKEMCFSTRSEVNWKKAWRCWQLPSPSRETNVEKTEPKVGEINVWSLEQTISETLSPFFPALLCCVTQKNPLLCLNKH